MGNSRPGRRLGEVRSQAQTATFDSRKRTRPRPLTAVTRVRIPYALPPSSFRGGNAVALRQALLLRVHHVLEDDASRRGDVARRPLHGFVQLQRLGELTGPVRVVPLEDDGDAVRILSLIHISEPTRLGMISSAAFCLKKK